MSAPPTRFILTVACPDGPGIVAAVAGFLHRHDFTILDSAQYGDIGTGLFFMRVHFAAAGAPRLDAPALRAAFAELAAPFGMDWQIHDEAQRPRVLILVSRFGHCLNDLLYRHRIGALAIDIPAIVSNHRDFYQLSAHHNIPFHHIPVSAATKARAEARLIEIIEEEQVELVVLARYMQVLSPELSARLAGRVINIHHSFLPSFKGAKPYQQAHERGVKLIGATAHFVTADLDEGPIIEQQTERVDHTMDPERLAAVGRDVEAVVLARAVEWVAQRRVFLNGSKTVVFR